MSATAVARRALGLLPAPALDRGQRLEARRLELRVRRSAAVRGAALVLHAVAPEGGDPALEINPPVTVDELDAAVGHLADRYRLVRAAELLDAARTRRPGEPIPVALTFDDDLPSHLEHAAPVMARHAATATAFLCGGERPAWWRLLQVAIDTGAIEALALAPVPARLVAPALERRPWAIGRLAKAIEDLPPADRDAVTATLSAVVPAPPRLSAAGREQLAAGGWELGFHTRRHDVLTALDDPALDAELDPAGTGVPPARTLAYPHGKAGPREARAARRAGYEAAFTGRAEVVTERADPHLVGRLQPGTATVGGFALTLARALTA